MANWRLLRWMGNSGAQKKLREAKTPPLKKDTSKRIKSDKDARGKRRGSESN